MQEFCGGLKPGLTKEALEATLHTKGLKLAMSDPNRGVIHEPKSYGRFLCEISLENNQISAAKYRGND